MFNIIIYCYYCYLIILLLLLFYFQSLLLEEPEADHSLWSKHTSLEIISIVVIIIIH
mgnify:FL=1